MMTQRRSPQRSPAAHARNADQREAAIELGGDRHRSKPVAGDQANGFVQHRGNRDAAARTVAEQIAAPGDAFLGQKIDQQQRRFADGRGAGAERKRIGTITAVLCTASTVKRGSARPSAAVTAASSRHRRATPECRLWRG
jgi:hypothetical protein